MKTILISSINPINSHNNGNTLLSFFEKKVKFSFIYIRNHNQSSLFSNNNLKFGNLKSILNLFFLPYLFFKFWPFSYFSNIYNKIFFLVGDNVSLMIYLFFIYKKNRKLSLYFTDNYFKNDNKFSNILVYILLKVIFKMNPDLYFINESLKNNYLKIFNKYFPKNVYLLHYNFTKVRPILKSSLDLRNISRSYNLIDTINIVYAGGLGIGRDSELLKLISSNNESSLHFHIITTTMSKTVNMLSNFKNSTVYYNLKPNEIAFFYDKADYFIHLENSDYKYVYKDSISTKLFEYLVYEKPILLSIPKDTYTFKFLHKKSLYIQKPFESNKIIDLIKNCDIKIIKENIRSFNSNQKDILQKALNRINKE